MTSPERSIRVDAIIIRHKDWGEADRLLTLYTQQKGKLRVIAKGVRKLTSRKSGHLEPFTRARLQIARGKDFWIVTQADTLTPNSRIQEELTTLGYASYICELVDRFSLEDEQNQALFKLLHETMLRLGGGNDQQLAIRYFEVHLLNLLGYRPRLMTCVFCSKEIKPEAQYFSIEEGGVVCVDCAGRISSARIPLSVEALKYLRYFQRSAYPEAARAIINDHVMAEMERLMQSYLTYLLEQKIRSTEFISIVRNQKNQRKNQVSE